MVRAGARSEPDSVVDLVLDLVPGDGGRAGSAYGATSASVSVSPTAPVPEPERFRSGAEPVVGAPVHRGGPSDADPLPAPAREGGAATASGPEFGAASREPDADEAGVWPQSRAVSRGPDVEVADYGAEFGAASGAPARDADDGHWPESVTASRVPDVDLAGGWPDSGAASREPDAEAAAVGAEIGAASRVRDADAAAGRDSEAAARPVAPEAGVLLLKATGAGTRAAASANPETLETPEIPESPETPDPSDTGSWQPAAEAEPFFPERDDAPGPGIVPGPGSAAGRRDAGPSLSLAFDEADTGEIRTDVRVDTGRHHSVIANERTASIPVHLLFRDDPEVATDAAALPAAVVRRAVGGEQTAGVRRPPVPRSPQVRPSTRPAPVADPRLHERPGPALPGWVALLTGLGGLAASCGVLWWAGTIPARVLTRLGLGPRPYEGLGLGAWAALALLLTVVLFALGGLTRGRVGYAWVLTLFGQYRGSVRRSGLMWVSPLLLRRRIDVRLRHWRSEPLPAVDANGTALRVVVLVVWRVKDTVRATLGIADHEEYLREQVEAAMARVLSQLPADAFHEDAHTLRNAEAVGDALTRMLKADCEPVGIEVYSAQPTGIEYAPEVAAAMQRRRIAAIDAKHRDSVLTSVVDAVDDTVNRLTARGLVELDDYERKSLVKDLTVAFYTGRSGGDSA
ncbi:SPFH domain-containing protein [Streptomyces sp. NPDC091263]|uniref:SPFH domain-containing protein n=1 Tax=Streptomyces sp. NPDC091263 TaxID=3155194 RepID=UPI00344E89E9